MTLDDWKTTGQGRGEADLIATYSGIFAGMSSAFAENLAIPERELLAVIDEHFIGDDELLVELVPKTDKYGESRYLAFTTEQLEILREVIQDIEVTV
mgnify:CR=1 FL=1